MPGPGDPGPNVEQWVGYVVARSPDRPTVQVVTASPQIRAADPTAVREVDAALEEIITGIKPRRPRRGQPRRNAYVAAEIAYMCDIERRPLDAEPFGVRPYIAEHLALTRDLGSWRSKTVTRWRDDGRDLLARIGAWPWAVVAGGRLPRAWWRDERFATALAEWSPAAYAKAVARLRPVVRRSRRPESVRSD